MPKTWVEISRDALRLNIVALSSLLEPGVQMALVVKANAYGHGLKEIVPLLWENGVRIFAVDSVEEGREVRTLFSGATIIVIGYTLHQQLAEVIELDLHQVVYDADTIRLLQEEAAKAGKRVSIHLKIETGTMRQGIWFNEIPVLVEIIHSCPHVDLVGVSTHFANIEEAEDASFAEYQMGQFLQAYEAIKASGFDPTYVHTACSAALILYPQTHGTLVRPGVASYGFWPSRETRHMARHLGRRIELEPVLSWKTKIAQIKEAPMNVPVGYGCTEILRRWSKIAVLPIGYWNGFDRGLSSIGEVLVRGQHCRVIGRICMNMCMVDVTEVPRVTREDEVVIIGRAGKNRMRADDIAQRLNTIHYEVTTRINPLIPRIVV
ncbi:MAG: alanine racemase [Patescibacteria group bacterium]